MTLYSISFRQPMIFQVVFFVASFAHEVTASFDLGALPSWLVPASEGVVQKVAVVLDQRLRQDGSPTQLLIDRVQAAHDFYTAGKVAKLVVSGGDPANAGHTEAQVMAELLEEAGVPSVDVIFQGQPQTTVDNALLSINVLLDPTGPLTESTRGVLLTASTSSSRWHHERKASSPFSAAAIRQSNSAQLRSTSPKTLNTRGTSRWLWQRPSSLPRV
mmetsp:Transcript_16279/g.56797  ORF Transcript_16279/g.56797 Transcript_16279/m.56797 type:complete len:216 (-) Transcript_16279:103-750(-)